MSLKRSTLAIQEIDFLKIIINDLNKISFIKKKKKEKKANISSTGRAPVVRRQ